MIFTHYITSYRIVKISLFFVIVNYDFLPVLVENSGGVRYGQDSQEN